MKNIGLKIAMIAIFVNAPRFVITFLAADGMRFPSWVEGAMLAITGIATGVVLTGGGAYIAHELIAMKGRVLTRVFMTVCWLLLLVFSVIILAPMMAAMLENSELVTVLDTVGKRLGWSVASIVAIEVLTAGAMVAHAASQDSNIAVSASNKPSSWSLVSNALASRIVTQLQPVQQMQHPQLQQVMQDTLQIVAPDIARDEIAVDATSAIDEKAIYLQRRANGEGHAALVRELNINPNTALSWWNRYKKTLQLQGGD